MKYSTAYKNGFFQDLRPFGNCCPGYGQNWQNCGCGCQPNCAPRCFPQTPLPCGMNTCCSQSNLVYFAIGYLLASNNSQQF